MENLEEELQGPIVSQDVSESNKRALAVAKRMREDPEFRRRVEKGYKQLPLTHEEKESQQARIYRLDELTSNYGA